MLSDELSKQLRMYICTLRVGAGGVFLLDIKSVKMMEEIPNELVINWDKICSSFSMDNGSKRVELEGVNDKRQITAVFAGSLMGDFLPVQLVYEGTTSKCYPSGVDFPADWLISATPNHWYNEETMLLYITKIIVPYLQQNRKRWVYQIASLHL